MDNFGGSLVGEDPSRSWWDLCWLLHSTLRSFSMMVCRNEHKQPWRLTFSLQKTLSSLYCIHYTLSKSTALYSRSGRCDVIVTTTRPLSVIRRTRTTQNLALSRRLWSRSKDVPGPCDELCEFTKKGLTHCARYGKIETQHKYRYSTLSTPCCVLL